MRPRRTSLCLCLLLTLCTAAVLYASTVVHIDARRIRDVNDDGRAVGYESVLVNQVAQDHACFYDTSVYDLVTLVGSDAYSQAYAVNEDGQVAGYSKGSNGWTRAFRWTDTNDNDMRDPGEMIDLGTLGGYSSYARAINDDGDCAGTAQTAGLLKYEHAFLWVDSNENNQADSGEMIDLGTLTGTASDPSHAWGMNDARVVVGQADSGIQYHAFMWCDTNGNLVSDSGEMIDLGTLGGSSSHAYDVNNATQVVGIAVDGSGRSRAFLWQDANNNHAADGGEMVDLGTLGGDNSTAYGINNHGHIVGTAQTTDGTYTAFLYFNGTMTNLNDFLPPASGWFLSEPKAISDDLFVVGIGSYGISSDEPFRLYIPEPFGGIAAAFALLIALRTSNR